MTVEQYTALLQQADELLEKMSALIEKMEEIRASWTTPCA